MRYKERVKVSFNIDGRREWECKNNLELADCKNQTEYFNKALEYYNAYLHTKENEEYVISVFADTLTKALLNSEKKMAQLQFKIAVELAKTNRMIGPLSGLDKLDLDRLHVDCVDEIKSIKGILTYEDEMHTRNR